MENKWRWFRSSVSIEHRKEFNKELVEINFVRSRNLALLLFTVFTLLIFIDYLNFQQGLWSENIGHKYLFYGHLFLTVPLFVLILYALFLSFKKVTHSETLQKQLFIVPFSYIMMIGSSAISVADQFIHGEITVYILCSFVMAIINYQKPIVNLGMYVIAHAIFITGITVTQTNAAILNAHYINGTVLIVIALFLSRILYSAKVNDFNSRVTIEQQNEELELANHELSAINQELQASLHALDESQNIIFSLTLTLESKDMNTHGHSERVGEYAMALARQLDLNDKDRTNLWRAAILHDIGKVGIPDAVLNKPSTLNQDEWDIMRSHPVRGEVICSKLRFAQEILPVIRYHHERYDGNGYPDGLKGDEIPFLARIVSIADTVDAMTSPRSYRTQPRTMDEAMEELQRCSGTQFDPLLVDAFLQIYRSDAVNQISKPLVSDYTIKAH